MSELFDKQVNAQKEFAKILLGLTQATASSQKVCNKNERYKQRKNDPFIKIDQI